MAEKLFILVICHLIGDYVLQSDFLATTKGENWYHLFVHSILYIVPFYCFFGGSMGLMALVTTHFITDALKARYKKLSYIYDQITHYFMIAVYYVLWLG